MSRKLPDIDTLVAYMETGYTLQEVGDIYGVCRERVRQVVTKAGHKDLIGHWRVQRKARIEPRVKELFEQGYKVAYIANVLGIHPNKVSAICIDNGWKTPWESQLQKDIVALSESGVSRAEISRRLNATPSYVSAILIRRGHGRLVEPGSRAEKAALVAELVAQGMTSKQIANQLEISPGYVTTLRADAGCPGPRGHDIRVDYNKGIALVQQGARAKDLMAHLGISSTTAYEIIHMAKAVNR